MQDVIRLLPDAVANQIAAGEVVQRPASAVKELLENSLDSGATEIRLIIKDGGSSLIQVIDNGCGMSETDARMAFERHATSKIQSAQDIYSLRTYGFRGEALASIAAVAQVELKTRRPEDAAATLIRIEGSKVLEQVPESGTVGTSITIKNLFFNIPARRNFLKSQAVESKHILEEFQRQALARPDVAFKFYNNGNETYNLRIADAEARIKEVLSVKKPLLEVHEQTEIIGITGHLGAPELARKTRGDQYFFVNGRFIRSPYFIHAVQAAYSGTIAEGSFPLFVLHFDIDPSKVDVNVHPTKTEVKFEDERHIYNILKSAVRKALSEHIVDPGGDLAGNGGIEDLLKSSPGGEREFWNNRDLKPSSGVPGYNPFTEGLQPRVKNQDWARILGPVDDTSEVGHMRQSETFLADKTEVKVQHVFQLPNKYVVAQVNNELFLIDPFVAQEKVLYNAFTERVKQNKPATQQLMFPRTLEFNPAKLHLLLDLLDEFRQLGFDLSHFGGNSVLVNGIPPELSGTDEQALVEKMLEDYETTQGDLKTGKHDRLALMLAKQAVRRQSGQLDQVSLESLINTMFAAGDKLLSFRNKTVAVKLGTELIQELFRKP